ncbi:MAG: hypothetical protein IMW86_01165 [Hydrogenibacillus sp.]|nr:hypothetical protein [Hydrogenibacillus sp.]
MPRLRWRLSFISLFLLIFAFVFLSPRWSAAPLGRVFAVVWLGVAFVALFARRLAYENAQAQAEARIRLKHARRSMHPHAGRVRPVAATEARRMSGVERTRD